MKSLLLLLALASPVWGFAEAGTSEDAPKVSLDKLAPRPPNPVPSEQPKDGLNPMLQKHVPRAGSKKRKSNVRVRGGATNGYGAGAVSGKVGEF